jgi:hypothetical protein
MRKTIIRYTCDAPDCEDFVDIEGPADTPTLQVAAPDSLPDGWVAFQVTGSSPGGQQQLVHASKPECAARLAEDQVAQAVEAGEKRKADEEEARERAEAAVEEARKTAEEQPTEDEG